MAFFQGFTMAGLNRKLDIPGLPTQMFLEEEDENSDELLRNEEGQERSDSK